jgi:hypothetical protein
MEHCAYLTPHGISEAKASLTSNEAEEHET